MSKKRIIKYTSRDFASIKNDLVDHARQYYPENYKDFNQSSFGSMMLDAVAYVGDMLSFYLDYQVNESMLDTAIEHSNIRRIANRYGYKYYGTPAAYGTATFYVIVPAATTGLGPNLNYLPTLRTGTRVSSTSGTVFSLTEDVDFSNPKNEIVAARFDDATGKPSDYAVRAYGQVRSGNFYSAERDVGRFERNLKIRVGDSDINSINKVTDLEGHEYYEVDNLSHDVIYKEITNSNAASDGIRSILKPYKAPRRFVVIQDETGTYLQFGYGSDEETTLDDVADPSSIALQLDGKNYITDTSFDPNKLLNTNKMGISPSNTTLRIVYGKNNTPTVSVAIGQLSSINGAVVEFPDETVLNSTIRQSVVSSMEISNEEVIAADASEPTKDEIKFRSLGALASQNRAVTKNDYESMAYMMPKKFGGVARVAVVNDPSSSNRRLSLYVTSVDQSGNFAKSNGTMKNNLKTWLNKNKMLNDSIDIFDAKIINIGMTYKITVDPQKDKYSTIAAVNAKIIKELTRNKMFIGEPLYISQIYNIINSVDGVIDAKSVKFENKNSGNYSATYVNMDELYSSDGMYLKTPKNAVLEIKYPENDIKGIVY